MLNKMNYVAHLYLSNDDPQILLGNFLGDFVKGPVGQEYPQKVAHGIRLHRRIDAFTDSHERVRCSRRLINPALARLSGILIDIFYDHFLINNWSKFSDQCFSSCVQQWYKQLHSQLTQIPKQVQKILLAMIEHDWLSAYQSVDGVHHVLQRVSQRIRFENYLSNGIECLKLNYSSFDEHFMAFFPSLINQVQKFK